MVYFNKKNENSKKFHPRNRCSTSLNRVGEINFHSTEIKFEVELDEKEATIKLRGP